MHLIGLSNKFCQPLQNLLNGYGEIASYNLKIPQYRHTIMIRHRLGVAHDVISVPDMDTLRD